MNAKKLIVFYIIFACFILGITEGVSYLILARSTKPRIGAEQFNTADFTEPVGDTRLVTLKKNLNINEFHFGRRWNIRTNGQGVRVPPDPSMEPAARQKIVFVGDSVPFGYGVNGDESFPYLISQMMPNYTVYNGGIPSYSLGQAVTRFEKEFRQLPNIRIVYLQIYDPVSEYAQFGSRWDNSFNWVTYPINASNFCLLSHSPTYKLLLKSNFIQLIQRTYSRKFCDIYAAPTAESDQRLKAHVRDEVDRLANMLPKDAKLIIAPVTPSPKSFKEMNDRYHHALALVNEQLEASAKAHGAYFLDTREIVTDHDVVDNCCHLSKVGAQKVADKFVPAAKALLSAPSQ